MTKTAVLVDGGFYRKRAAHLWGKKTAKARASELVHYVFKHIDKTDGPYARELYRIFYYDCPPLQTTVYHPLKGNVDFGKLETYQWTLDFFDELKRQRKMALRLGRLSDFGAHFDLKPSAVKGLCSGKITVDDLTERDFAVSFVQKGVDMRLGVDISSLAYEGIVNQIILIAGDSDFVPAAKAARRKGIDFILDPMGHKISDDLFEHIDGKESFIEEGDPQPPRRRKKQRPSTS
ncbi:MAG: NYN domain-containing protein [Adlercreutzia sp.]|nr:NYN domain-containing protein [Adlercreutzia sp.]